MCICVLVDGACRICVKFNVRFKLVVFTTTLSMRGRGYHVFSKKKSANHWGRGNFSVIIPEGVPGVGNYCDPQGSRRQTAGSLGVL